MELCYNENDQSNKTVVLSAVYAGLVHLKILKQISKAQHLKLLATPNLKTPAGIMFYLINKAPMDILHVLTCKKSPILEAKVNEWITYAASENFNIMDQASLHTLNAHLLENTFFVSSHITLADVVIYGSVHNWFLTSTEAEKNTYLNLQRWFDYIQHLPGFMDNPDNPFCYIKLPVSDNDSNQNESKTDIETKDAKETEKTKSDKKEKVKQEKDKQENAGKKKEKTKAKATDIAKDQCSPVAETRPLDDITRLEIRVGKIIKVTEIQDSDNLYMECIDIGEEKPRQIVSGLRKHITKEQLQDSLCLVLANLPEKKLRGALSHGMVLCGCHTSGEVKLILPPQNAKVGELVTFKNYEGEPDSALNTKTGKNPFVAIQPHLKVKKNTAMFKDSEFMTSAGACKCNLEECNIQ